MNQLDFLAVGDITTDAFIRLTDAHVNCSVDKTKCELCVRFADKIPYESVTVVRAVGNAPNAAVAAARLNLAAGLVSDIGDDENGRECLAALGKEKVNTSFVTTHNDAKTNYHFVLWYEAERTILVKHEAYDYKLPALEPAPKWLYLSSLGGNSEAYHYEIIAYLENHPEVQLAFQPGTFQIQLGTEKLKKLYERAAIFFCNKEEAQRILRGAHSEADFGNVWLSPAKTGRPEDFSKSASRSILSEIHALGPKIVCITDGPNGAYAYDGHMNEYWFMPIYPDPAPPLSRTGAGDAFASSFTAAIILGKSVKEALRWAPLNSAFVVQQVGAQKGLLTRQELERSLKDAPADYAPRFL